LSNTTKPFSKQKQGEWCLGLVTPGSLGRKGPGSGKWKKGHKRPGGVGKDLRWDRVFVQTKENCVEPQWNIEEKGNKRKGSGLNKGKNRVNGENTCRDRGKFKLALVNGRKVGTKPGGVWVGEDMGGKRLRRKQKKNGREEKMRGYPKMRKF